MFVLYRYYVEACGHSSPPPPPFFVGGPGHDWNSVLSPHGVVYPEETITFLRLGVVESFRLSLVSVGVGLMCVLTMLSLSTERP